MFREMVLCSILGVIALATPADAGWLQDAGGRASDYTKEKINKPVGEPWNRVVRDPISGRIIGKKNELDAKHDEAQARLDEQKRRWAQAAQEAEYRVRREIALQRERFDGTCADCNGSRYNKVRAGFVNMSLPCSRCGFTGNVRLKNRAR